MENFELCQLFTGVDDTGDNLLVGSHYYQRYIISGVVDTGNLALSRIFIDSMTPVIIYNQ
jgi:hypothetical protein